MEKRLYNKALEGAKNLATATYSGVHVGAAALLDSGEIVLGGNHENCSYPVGICAERSLLCSVLNQYPKSKIVALAVAAIRDGSRMDISPCGMCRQAILEQEILQKSHITVIFHHDDKIIKSSTAAELLPYSFRF